ncbi:MAG: hypothetical protein KAH95_05290 [Spirochaetales bacterium]|nr:hypothetical protein [Spirochaetales bacterium]
MISFKKLDDILATSVEWEQQMGDLYDVAEIGLKTKESKELLSFLKENHQKNLNVIKKLNVNDYGPNEWVKFTADFSILSQIPKHQITKESTTEEIFSKVKKYEESLHSFYQRVSEHTISENQTELFSSLALMKNNQLDSIKNFIDSFFNPNLG